MKLLKHINGLLKSIPSENSLKKYFLKHGLNLVVDSSNKPNRSVNEMVVDEPYKPELKDLYILHKLINETKRTTVLEFGCGWSSLVMSHALDENSKRYSAQVKNLRRNNLFEHHSIDNEKKYLNISRKRILDAGFRNSFNHFSKVYMYEYLGRLSTRYEFLPQINPDFIYLDAPDQFNVSGKVNGLSTAHKDFMPMSSDILLIEHFLTPGTIILIDGRTANARFLKANFQRSWEHSHDIKNDQHIFVLNEQPLGSYNKAQIEFYNFK